LGPGVSGYSLTLQARKTGARGAWSAGRAPGPAATWARTRERGPGTWDRAPGSASSCTWSTVPRSTDRGPGPWSAWSLVDGSQVNGSRTRARAWVCDRPHKHRPPGRRKHKHGPRTWARSCSSSTRLDQARPGSTRLDQARPGSTREHRPRTWEHGPRTWDRPTRDQGPGGLVPGTRPRASRGAAPVTGSPGGGGLGF